MLAIACAKPVAPKGRPPSIDPSVSEVATFGQWLEAAADGKNQVVHTVRVAELGDFAVVQQISHVPTESEPNRVELRVVNTYTMEEARFCVVAAAERGRYSVEPSPCPAAD